MRLRPKRGGEGHARNEDLRAESCRLPDGRGHEAAAVMLRVCYGRGCPRHGDHGYEEHSGSHSLARAAEDRGSSHAAAMHMLGSQLPAGHM